MHLLRELLICNGWKMNEPDEHIEQQDVNEFFTFLMDIFEGPLLEIKRFTITEAKISSDENDEGTIEQIPFIPLTIPPNTELSVKELTRRWMYENYVQVKRKIDNDTEILVQGLNTYRMMNSPNILSFSINRYNNEGKKNSSKLIINKKIRPQNNSDLLERHVWIFQAAICHKGNSLKEGHYYSLLYHNDHYYIFDDLCIPSLKIVNMKDPDISNAIKEECVFIIYRFLY